MKDCNCPRNRIENVVREKLLCIVFTLCMNRDRPMFYEASKNVFRKACMLRNNMTVAERMLWARLNKKQICGLRFKAQHPMGPYIADFYCHKARLVIEVDEKYHQTEVQQHFDQSRDRLMSEMGISVLRFSDIEIFEQMTRVIETIVNHLKRTSAVL